MSSSVSSFRVTSFINASTLIIYISHLIPWIALFLNFEPWCLEAQKEIDTAVSTGLIELNEFERDDGVRGRFYFLHEEEPSLPKTVPQQVVSELRAKIRDLGASEELPKLLDFVYFETEPMIDARPRSILDFSQFEKPQIDTVAPIPRLSKKQIKKGKELLSRLTERQKNGHKEFRKRQYLYLEDDEHYRKAIGLGIDHPTKAEFEGPASIGEVENSETDNKN